MSQRHSLEVPRTARYHVRGVAELPGAILFLLHGYGQLAAAFLESLGALATPGRLLVAPEALSRFYLKRGSGAVGATWMTREEREAEIADNVRYLDLLHARIARESGARFPLQAFGFSQGGATAARWALLGAAPVARCTLWGCPFPPDLDLDHLAVRARTVEWCFVLGEQDETIERSAWEAGLARLRAVGVEPVVLRFAGGHELDAATLTRIAGT